MKTETSTKIIRATRCILCRHGYADLTIQRIADESDVSTAAIHYHFDTKETLLNAFLDDMIEQFIRRLACDESNPNKRLSSFLDAAFTPPHDGEQDVAVALMELKAQAPYHELYRERFLELDARMQAVVEGAVRDGIESGEFDEVPPESIAHSVVTAINGSHSRKVTLGESPQETREALEEYLVHHLDWTPEVNS